MTDEDLRAIEERAGAATPGPWEGQGETEVDPIAINLTFDHDYNIYPPLGYAGPVAVFSAPEDALFTIRARQDVPALLAEVRRLQGEVDELVRREELGIREVGDLATEAEGLRSELARYKWTRVSEGLPETEGTYWVVYQTPAQRWTAEQKFKDGAFNTPWPRFITHWMHIPPVEGE